MTFPKDFVWGAATSAYQIEGAAEEGGRGRSIWDDFCHTPSKVWQGDSGDVACDHYHRLSEDVALMKDLGINAYRFSLSWPRILPSGEGTVNEEGMLFYERLVDELLAARIEPWITLYHWDLPMDLYVRGGWLNGSMPELFAAYTKVVVERLSDRVSHWMTLNEPQCFIGLGLDRGSHAPGVRLPRNLVLRAAHHALLAHGRAVQTIREHAKLKPQIGWAPVAVTAFPATETEADISAARQAMFTHHGRCQIVHPTDQSCLWGNTWWGDPVVFGHYPEDEMRAFGNDVPDFSKSDMQTISTPIDFYGANLYNGSMVCAGQEDPVRKVQARPGSPRTHFYWPVTPQALYWGPRFLHERYNIPIVIAENGMACADWVDLDGRVEDPQRIDFTRRYLQQLKRAAAEGVHILGYFHWSLMDNFEWAEGFRQRFGLIHVDFDTLKRTPKRSFYWYKDVIASNGGSLD